jgi:hypothetical protein
MLAPSRQARHYRTDWDLGYFREATVSVLAVSYELESERRIPAHQSHRHVGATAVHHVPNVSC